MGNNTLIFIPFRKGSKGILNKNIRKLNGKSLFKYTLHEAILAKWKSDSISSIVIATDYTLDELTLTWEKDEISYWNRKDLPSVEDDASTETAIDEYLKENNLFTFENIMLIQVTNPFLTSKQIIESTKQYKNVGTLMSVVPFNRYIWTSDGSLLFYKNRSCRQEMENLYLENGSFYVFNLKEYLISKNRMNKPVRYYQMPIESSFEIDDEKDWCFVEKILKK